MKNKIYKDKNICNYSSIANIGVSFQPSPVTDFYMVTRKSPNSKTPSVKIIDDVHMLFNQKRLDSLTLRSFTDYINSQASNNSTLSSLRKKMTDSQLYSFVKSRYIQSISELQSWALYLDSCAESLKGELKEQLEIESKEIKDTTSVKDVTYESSQE